MKDLKFVVYSHNEYSEILKIQTDYLDSIENKTLIIDNNFLDENILSKYNSVIGYDDRLPYASRLLNLKNLDDKYILLIHDIDILLKYSESFLSECVKIMEKENIHRIDLQYFSEHWNPNSTKKNLNYGENCVKLIKQDNLNGYIYNVNPSIWKLDIFLDLMENFKDRTYRNIESIDVQSYASKFNIFKLYNDEFLQVGYFKCLQEFLFLHISHSGQFLPLKGNDLPEEVQKIYDLIVEKYLKNSNRGFRGSLHG